MKFNFQQLTALHLASYSGSEQCAAMLLAWGCKINTKNIFGCTPLHVSAISGEYKITRKLLLYNAKTRLKNKQGKTAQELSEQNEFLTITQMIMEYQEGDIKCSNLFGQRNKPRINQKTRLQMYAFIFMLILNLIYQILFSLGNNLFGYIQIILDIFQICLFVFIINSDPGYQVQYKKEGQIFYQILQNNPKKLEICAECETLKAKRSRHCDFCNRCIKVYDHHCPWINNCIGAKNHFVFIIFIWITFLTIGFQLFVSIVLFINIVWKQSYIGILSSNLGYWDTFDFLFNSLTDLRKYFSLSKGVQIEYIVLELLITLMFFVLLSHLLCTQLKNMYYNRTTFERLSKKYQGFNNQQSSLLESSYIENEVSNSNCLRNCSLLLFRNKNSQDYNYVYHDTGEGEQFQLFYNLNLIEKSVKLFKVSVIQALQQQQFPDYKFKAERDNIQVSIRIKPLLEDGRSCIKLDSNLKNTIIIEGNQQQQQDQKYFYFDYVAQQDSTQEDIFNIVGKQQAINCLDGYNGCVFVYGQTGSGKTYTMMGTQKQPGLLPRVIDFLFNCIQEDSSEYVEYLVKCSYLEIYNEHIIDLLNPQLGNLQLREDLKKGVYVEQLSEEVCTNVAESLEVLQRGSLNRHISSTQMNIESSRSHSVFTIQLESRRQSSQTQVINHRFSRFHFVDLAGSERQKQSQVQGERLREGCNINKSLHILGNVINSLVEDNQSYVHYRDSKLTFLLKDSLGGNSRTHLIANIQQSQQFYQETLSTLMFSKRVKQVRNKARINEDESGNLESLKNEIKRLKQELAKSVTQQQKWESPKKFEQKQQQSQINEQFLQSLELESLMINDQKYIKLEEILKCYLEQSTESETALFLEIEKYLNGIKQLKEGFQLGQQLEQQLKFVIKLQNEQIQKLKLNQQADEIQQQIQQQLAYALQCQGLVMKTFYENLTLKEQQGATQTVSKVQVQVDTNLNLLKEIVETVQNSLNERRLFQQQIDTQFNSQYVTLDKFKELETQSEYKEKLLQSTKLYFQIALLYIKFFIKEFSILKNYQKS